MNTDNDFDIPETASIPPSVSTQPAKAPMPEVRIQSEPTRPDVIPWTAFPIFADALREVQRLQLALDHQGRATRADQRKYWAIGQALDGAKAHSAKIQQGPPDVPISACAMLAPEHQPTLIHRVQTLRERLLQTIKK
jgi:hypothetical protein